MKAQLLQTVIILLAATSVAGAAGMKRQKYIPYKATADEIATTNIAKKVVYDQTFEEPTNEIFKDRLHEALNMAAEEESRIRYMVAQGMVRTNYWNGMYSGSVIVESQKTICRFTFKSSKLELQQVEKIVFSDKINGKRDRSSGYSFTFLHDSSDSVSSFSHGQGEKKVTLGFHENGKLESCGLTIGDEYYRASWDEDGKLVSETKRKIKE